MRNTSHVILETNKELPKDNVLKTARHSLCSLNLPIKVWVLLETKWTVAYKMVGFAISF